MADVKARAASIGPQVGFILPISKDYQGYLTVKANKDFAAEDRAEGCRLGHARAFGGGIRARSGRPALRR